MARNWALCRFAISDPTQNRDHITVPILGTTRVHERSTWDHNAVLIFGHFFIQAAAFWQWCRMPRAAKPEGKTPLILDLDETNIRFVYPPQRGL